MMRLLLAFGVLFGTTALAADLPVSAGGASTPDQFIVAPKITPQYGVVSRIKDIGDWGSARSNQLVGYGLVVGLAGTGDGLRTTPFAAQSLRAMLTQLGIAAGDSRADVANIAAVVVTADLPPFVQPGTRLDARVSSIGDATSLRGGTLVMTPLRGGNDEVYAVAQGSVIVNGFNAAGAAQAVQAGVPTTGRLAGGAIVENEPPAQLAENRFTMLLRNGDFATSVAVADAMNIAASATYGSPVARAKDSRTIDVIKPQNVTPARFLAHMEGLSVTTDQAARVVMNANSGTVVIGAAVRVARVAVTHGTLTVRVEETPFVSQPNPFTDGATVVLPETQVDVAQPGGPFSNVGGTDLQSLVDGLNSLGTTPSDTIAILQAIKSAGALQAELVVQ